MHHDRYDAGRVRAMEANYHAAGAIDRDMECGAVFLIGQLRGIQTACVLQCVIKGGGHHANPGTTGIPLVLETLYKVAQQQQ
jgi:uridine phosphorylase